MESQWSDKTAEETVAAYDTEGVNRDLALRVYSSRLLGRDPRLVLHGGGNTSVKTTARDLLDEELEVLCVKGSGWDMAEIEPPGLPAVRLAPLRRLRERDSLGDADMVNFQRRNLLDPGAPNPSVETLLHAFLPHKFVDHTHAIAVLSLTDQPHGEALCREVYGRRVGYVPYIMPGFALAKKAAEVFEADQSVEGLVLLKHGIFSFGDTAAEAYGRMIELVSLAEKRLQKGGKKVFNPAALPRRVAPLAEVAPIVRGACALAPDKRQILDFRGGPEILNYVNGEDLGRYAQAGVVTPDHAIRTKNWPLILSPPEAGGLERFAGQTAERVAAFVDRYRAYFTEHNARQTSPKTELDPLPRVVLVPGLGLFGLGKSAADAAVAADIAENTVAAVSGAEAIGSFESVSEADLFHMEYWSLEQAKLARGTEKPLARQVVMVTGGGGAIGGATARAFGLQGCEVAVLDLDEGAARAVADGIGGAALALACDVTDKGAVGAAFDAIVETFGGVDIVVSNAGAAWRGAIGEVDEAVLRQSFELNFFAHQRVAQNAVRVMRAQGTGGVLLFNTSKQAVNPGPDFGPYGTAKAATLLLMRQYALEYGALGIRANAVNADRVRGGLLTDEMVKARAKARGVGEDDYMTGNLLGREVTADDVAQAFVHLACAPKTTAGVTTVDGGNIPAALR